MSQAADGKRTTGRSVRRARLLLMDIAPGGRPFLLAGGLAPCSFSGPHAALSGAGRAGQRGIVSGGLDATVQMGDVARQVVTMRIAVVQMQMGAEPGANLARAVSLVEEAGRRGAAIVCLPELFRSRYFCQVEDPALFDLSESIPGPTTEALAEVARRLGVAIIAPVFERRAPGLYHNSAVVLDVDGRQAGLYRKMHIPDDPSYYEKFYFAPGDLGFRAFDTRAGRVGVLICWDQWYPEAARLTALQGPDVLFYPTAIGWHPAEKAENGAAQRDAWRTIQRGHAIANGVYVAAANRVGHEPSTAGEGLEFWGSSFVADPQGVVLAEASTDREEVLIADVETERVEEVRRNWPFLRDRRIDAYQDIGRRFMDGEQA